MYVGQVHARMHVQSCTCPIRFLHSLDTRAFAKVSGADSIAWRTQLHPTLAQWVTGSWPDIYYDLFMFTHQPFCCGLPGGVFSHSTILHRILLVGSHLKFCAPVQLSHDLLVIFTAGHVPFWCVCIHSRFQNGLFNNFICLLNSPSPGCQLLSFFF